MGIFWLSSSPPPAPYRPRHRRPRPAARVMPACWAIVTAGIAMLAASIIPPIGGRI